MNRTTRRLPGAWLAFLAGLAALGVFACGPPGEPSGLTPQERLDSAAGRMQQVTSLEFALSHEEGHTPLLPGVVLRAAEGATRDPGQASMRVEGVLSALNSFLEMEITVDGENATMTDPFSGAPMPVPTSQLPFNLHGLGGVMAGILSAIESPMHTGTATLEDVPSEAVSGTISGADLQPLIPAADASLQQRIEVWAGQDDLVRRVRIEGKVLADDPDAVVRVLTFTAFDEAQPSAR